MARVEAGTAMAAVFNSAAPAGSEPLLSWPAVSGAATFEGSVTTGTGAPAGAGIRTSAGAGTSVTGATTGSRTGATSVTISVTGATTGSRTGATPATTSATGLTTGSRTGKPATGADATSVTATVIASTAVATGVVTVATVPAETTCSTMGSDDATLSARPETPPATGLRRPGSDDAGAGLGETEAGSVNFLATDETDPVVSPRSDDASERTSAEDAVAERVSQVTAAAPASRIGRRACHGERVPAMHTTPSDGAFDETPA